MPDRNPLRRRTDRVEAGVVTGLALLFLAGAPVAAISAGQWAYQTGLRQQQVERSWHRVPAVLLRTAPEQRRTLYPLSWMTVWEPARWTGSGVSRTGWAEVRPGTIAGSAVPVWVNGSGHQTAVPLRAGQLSSRVAGAEVLAPLCVAVLLGSLGGLVRWRLNHRRMAAWDTAWARVGPRWTRHK